MSALPIAAADVCVLSDDGDDDAPASPVMDVTVRSPPVATDGPSEPTSHPSFSSPPRELVQQLKAELGDELLAHPATLEMVRALGGDPRCFERFIIARQRNVAQAAKQFRGTAAFRRERCFG